MLDDGYGPYLFGPPQDNFFPNLLRSCDSDPEKVFAVVNEFLQEGDAKFEVPPIVRAGQCVCWHPGEQVHAGVGPGGYVSTLTQSKERKTLFGVFVPTILCGLVDRNPIFGTEGQTWGLMADKWNPDRVDFLVFLHTKPLAPLHTMNICMVKEIT